MLKMILNIKTILHTRLVKKIRTSKSGMSLVELISTLAILGLILYPIYEFLRQGALSWETGENKTEVIQNARIGLDKMCDEIKHAREFYTITSDQISFWYADTNDNKIADNDEILTFSWSGTSGDDLLRRFSSEAVGSPLANYVDLLEFKYYDKNSYPTISTGSVHFITANIKIKKTSKLTEYTSTMRKAIHPRNI